MPAFILMGVSGSGKSTIGQCVAQSLRMPFIEGDDHHPPQNIAKMAGGTPLNDADRTAWIDALMNAVNARHEPDVVIACSALTHSVRERIRRQSSRPVVFLHLTADPTLIEQRLRSRGRHFMKPGMLPSQLAALQASPAAVPIDVTPPIDQVCTAVRTEIMKRAHSTPGRPSV